PLSTGSASYTARDAGAGEAQDAAGAEPGCGVRAGGSGVLRRLSHLRDDERPHPGDRRGDGGGGVLAPSPSTSPALGEGHERLGPAPRAGETAGPLQPVQPDAARLREAPVLEHVERLAEPGGAIDARSRGHARALREERDLLPRLACVRLVSDAAQACERVVRPELCAHPRLADGRVAHVLGGTGDASGALRADEARAHAREVARRLEQRARDLLDPVAVPAPERVARILRAERTRR